MGEWEIGLLLRQAHRKAADAFNEGLRPLGIEGRHFGLLLTLQRQGPLSQRALIDRLSSDKSSMVRLVDSLEDRGLCAREPAEGDRRAYAVRLTPAGRALVARAQGVADEVVAVLLADFEPEARTQLHELLRRFLAGAASTAAPRGDQPRSEPTADPNSST
jgi:DNA-binding MarR family transcriptional regulator